MARHSLKQCETFAGGWPTPSLDHPECPALGRDGCWYTGGEAGQVFRIGVDGAVHELANVGGGVGGIAIDADNNVYECNYGNGRVHRITPNGDVSVYSTGTSELPSIQPNFPVFDEAGNMFFTDSGAWGKANGRLYVVRPSGATEVLIGGGLHFPNGLALSPGGDWLYMIESSTSCISRMRVRGVALDEPEEVVILPDTLPDGLVFAAGGNLYVACFTPDAIFVIEPNGKVELVVGGIDPWLLSGPANGAFAPGDEHLYYANHKGWTLGRLDVGELGMPLRYPHLG